MKKLYSLPDDRTILDCLANDILGRNEDVVRFCTILDSFDQCMTISLDGAWGSGKTFFVKQAKMLLDGFCINSELESDLKDGLERIKSMDNSLYKDFKLKKKHTTVYYDAWENDNDSDPILSIINALIKSKQVSTRIGNDRSAVDILSTLADCVTGRSISALCNAIKGNDFLADIKRNESVNEIMRDFLNKAIGAENNRLVIFIDELDRCKPTFAIALLERIKHFFTDERLTFVFSVNQNQLLHTIKSYYGFGMDASKYLEKSFDISIPLPAANYDRFLQSQGFKNDSYVFNKTSYSVVRYFNFGLREISKYIQYLDATILDIGNNKRKINAFSGRSEDFCLLYIAPILIGLRLHSITDYIQFTNGKFPNPFVDLLSQPDRRRNISGYIVRTDEYFPEHPARIDNLNRGQVPIDIHGRLLDIYYAIFRDQYDSNLQNEIGMLTFDKYTKSTLLDYVNPISKYAKLD